MSELRERLRALPTFPETMPVLDPGAVPTHPLALFTTWLDDAIASGARQPNAFTLSTIGEDGAPASRTLIVKDVDEHGLHFSSNRGSRKGQELERNPVATALFFWRELGRQVEVSGFVTEMGADASAADWRERPSYVGQPNPEWVLWALEPTRCVFLQATLDRKHVRVEYLRGGDGWEHRQPTTPAG
ncbi:Pyridoxamine 5'-phosphate oxidase [Agrococcus baldri]|uniref:Pyridoxamine 5'-phosphate oxidase n=1 Tax=Agrococcus baldri TaxID=153730 RepID=A0AA94KYM1_9MICO|nr:pyridoxamine 5'-phosphate oxidase family protein [Agrococcus baldri]SFR99854.1 Pyridoxamine 5'-phosphate oxidase [Agrococcus baldri]